MQNFCGRIGVHQSVAYTGTAGQVTNGVGIANVRIVKVGSTYEMFAEVSHSSGAQWRITRWTSSTLASGRP